LVIAAVDVDVVLAVEVAVLAELLDDVELAPLAVGGGGGGPPGLPW
jgi:hypothetical protein